MSSILLKKLLGKKNSQGVGLERLFAEQFPEMRIYDADERPLMGEAFDLLEEKLPIIQDSAVLGWVAASADSDCKERLASAAQMLSFLAESEAEKKSLATEVLDKYRELNLLYNLSDAMAASPHPETITGTVLERITGLITVTQGMIALYDEGYDAEAKQSMSEEGKPADQKLQLTATFGSGYTLREDALTSESVVHRVLQTGRAEIVNNIPASHFLEAEADAQISVLSAPLKTEKRVLGVIILISEQREFTAHDLRLLNTIAMQAAPTIEITHLYQLAVEKARMERELQIARQVQVGLLPSSTPSLPGYEFAGYWRPAREVSGDYYDFIQEQEDRMGLVIADVTDKGMPASLFMVFARSAVRSSIGRYSSPMRAIQQANQLICSESSYGLFTTLFYARLFTKTGRITYVNAGHNPPLYYQARPDKIKPLIRTGIPLGIFDDSTYSQRTIQLDANDFIFCYTDGLTEAINEQGEDFGMQRLQTVIYENRGASAQTIVNALSGAIDEFAGPAPPFDDFTMMVVKRV